MNINYDNLASDYINYRVPDARIAAAIWKHIPSGNKILNVGAGQGSYEPAGSDLVALEPSWEMISRRAKEGVPVIQGHAEKLPFSDNSFDISLAILTIHHWHDIEEGLREIFRVTRRKTLIFTWNGDFGDFWLPDYLPEIAAIDSKLFPSMDKIREILGGNTKIEAVEIPHDCTDGFMCAYWRRPDMYLNTKARNAISTFSRLNEIDDGLKRLHNDVETGLWHQRYESLLTKNNIDCGYRLLVSDI